MPMDVISKSSNKLHSINDKLLLDNKKMSLSSSTGKIFKLHVTNNNKIKISNPNPKEQEKKWNCNNNFG